MAARALAAVQRPPPAAVAAPGRARPLLVPSLLPLSLFHLARIDRLVQLVGDRYLGWGRELESRLFFVDVAEAGAELGGCGKGVERYHGEGLHAALGAALRAARGTR